MYSSIWTHRIQNLWAIISGILAVYFVRYLDLNLWASIPIAIIGFIIVAWTGITIISMFDHNHRMAAKYGIKIENLPLYFEVFERMVEAEMQGIDTSGLPSEIKDPEEWFRFCRWQIDEGLKGLGHENDI